MTNKKTNAVAAFFKENLVLIGIVVLCNSTICNIPVFTRED